MNRLYLHVGMMKTGTTYLQNVFRANHEALAGQGVWYPAGPDAPRIRLAVWDLVGRRPKGAPDTRITGQWDLLTRRVAEHSGQTVLLSEEYLASRPSRVARRAVAGFPSHEVHVVVTARDWGRMVVSAWEETVKSGQTLTWPEFIDRIRDPDRAHRDPARSFWLRQDLPMVLETWAAVVGASRVHVVTVPRAGAPRGTLLARFGELVGFDAAQLREPVERTNESFGAPAIEVLRRLNTTLEGRLNQRQYDIVVKRTVGSRPPATDRGARLGLPDEHWEWAAGQARRVVEHVRSGGFHVVGDLEDLLSDAPVAGRAPDEFTDQELVESALHLLGVMTESHARLWWRRGRRDEAQSTQPSIAGRASSALRGAGYRAQRKVAQLADKNRVAGAAMGVYLRSRRRVDRPRRHDAAEGSAGGQGAPPVSGRARR